MDYFCFHTAVYQSGLFFFFFKNEHPIIHYILLFTIPYSPWPTASIIQESTQSTSGAWAGLDNIFGFLSHCTDKRWPCCSWQFKEHTLLHASKSLSKPLPSAWHIIFLFTSPTPCKIHLHEIFMNLYKQIEESLLFSLHHPQISLMVHLYTRCASSFPNSL